MKCLPFSFLLLLLIACTNNANEKPGGNDSGSEAGSGYKENELPSAPAVPKSDYYVWEVDADARTIRKNPSLPTQYIQVDTLLAGINEKFPQIKLEKQHIGHDTLYTHIRDADHLTNRMGSLGAEHYIANAVLNLTAVQGINFVRIDFAEGSHAAPDVWSREAFKDYKEKSN